MPYYKGGAHTYRWYSQLLSGAVNTTIKPVVKIYQNGTSVTIDPSRVLHAGEGWWYVAVSALETGYDYVDFLATDAALIPYALSVRTDDATATVFAMSTDFTNVVRPHILAILGAVIVNGVSVIQRIGSMTGTGINNLYGFLLAMVSKTATKPSDMVGTYDPASDSLEALRDRGDAAWITGSGGGGGSTVQEAIQLNSTDTVRQINDTPFEIVAANAKTINVKVLSGQTVYFANTSGTITVNDKATAVAKEVTSEDSFLKLRFENKCFVYTLEGTARITYTVEV